VLVTSPPYSLRCLRGDLYGEGMRLTEFRELVLAEFGQARGDALVADHVLGALGGQTAAQALEAGIEPRDAWRALCTEFDVPPSRQ